MKSAVYLLCLAAAMRNLAFGAEAPNAVKPEHVLLAGFAPGAVPEAEATAKAFAAALKGGDRAAVLDLLSARARIREGGHTQTRAEYAAEHLAADIAFLRTAQITPISFGSKAIGDGAQVHSESEIRAISSKGKPIALRSREMLSLKREGADWKIVDVQWESNPLVSAEK